VAKKAAMEAGHKASMEAIKQGLSFDEATRLSREAMLFALNEYKPKVVGHEKALLNVYNIRNKFVEKENERSGIFTEEVEINDYPQFVRAKVQSWDYLSSIGEMTSCKVQVKGQFYEVGRKPPPGHRRLYLLVEGQSKHEVSSAVKEIKRNLEEHVVQNARH